jgi:prepilin-type N-terminal cleavage/methylation domain-containing protein
LGIGKLKTIYLHLLYVVCKIYPDKTYKFKKMKNHKSEMRNKKGFSLVELLVVITIIAILSVVAYSAVAGNTIKARDSKRLQDISIIQQALELYYTEKGVYPSSPLSYTVGANLLTKKILSDIPVDPGIGKHSYSYVLNGTTYQLGTTLEKDGILANYEAYVVGNSDTNILTAGSNGRYFNGTALAACTGTLIIGSGKIQTANAAYDPGPPAKSCIPYDPLI